MHTYDILGFYCALAWLTPGAPVVHRFSLHELDGKCRTSTAHFVRLWPTRLAVLVGRWHPTGDTPDERFEQVFAARQIDPLDGTGGLQERYQRETDVPDGWTLVRPVGDR